MTTIKVPSLSPLTLRTTPEFSELQKQCAGWASGAGVATGFAAHAMGKSLFASGGLGAKVFGIGMGLAAATVVYNKMETKQLENLRVKKINEHYQYMRPIFDGVVIKTM